MGFETNETKTHIRVRASGICTLRRHDTRGRELFVLFCPILREDIKSYCHQEDKAFNCHLPVDVNTHDGHTVVEYAHHQSTDDCSNHRADAAGGGSAADEAGSDGV